jgi:hypothetical protein
MKCRSPTTARTLRFASVRNCRSEEEPEPPWYFYVFEFLGVVLGNVSNWRVLGLSSSHRLQGEFHA